MHSPSGHSLPKYHIYSLHGYRTKFLNGTFWWSVISFMWKSFWSGYDQWGQAGSFLMVGCLPARPLASTYSSLPLNWQRERTDRSPGFVPSCPATDFMLQCHDPYCPSNFNGFFLTAGDNHCCWNSYVVWASELLWLCAKLECSILWSWCSSFQTSPKGHQQCVMLWLLGAQQIILLHQHVIFTKV